MIQGRFVLRVVGRSVLAVAICLSSSSCINKEQEGTPAPDGGNEAPVALINGSPEPDEITVGEGQCFSIDGSDSYDPDGSIVSAVWTATGGAIALTNPSSLSTSACALQDVSSNVTGALTLTVRDNAGATASEQVRVVVVDTNGGGSDTANNTRSGAESIDVGGTRSGAISPAGDADYYVFTVSGTGTLTVQTTGSTDTVGQLENSIGTVIGQDDDGGADSNFSIAQQVSAGSYYVRVAGYDGTATGSYTLDVSFNGGSGGSSSMTWQMSDGCSDGQATHLKFFDRTNNLVWPSSSEVYVLGVQGQTYTFNLSCATGANICYGAEPASRPGTYWGVSLDNDNGCSNCCGTCNGGTYGGNLVCP